MQIFSFDTYALPIFIFSMFFLAFFLPTLNFCSVNTQFFTTAQIRNSLCVAFFAGLLSGLGGAWAYSRWPSVWLVRMLFLLPSGCFILLSERFFTETIPDIRARTGIEAGLMAFAALCVWLEWYFVLPSILAICGFFAVYDLSKNWQRAKNPIFDPELVKPVPEPVEKITFTKRPNVYLLLLESLHSSEALKKVYGIKITGAEDCFRKHGLTVYPRTFSNKHSTTLSLKTLLSMSLDFKAPPLVMEHFVRNGYKCYFYDSMYYLSQPYIKYIANENAKMPFWVYRLYSIIGPIMAQSRWPRKLAGNIDPFETAYSNRLFSAMLEDFQDHLDKAANTPSFNILHFGATHFGDMWYRIENPQKTYLESYANAIVQLRTVLETITKHDPEAVIVAVGDHGSFHWTGVTNGPEAPELNALRNGVSLDALAHDFFGVALGIRWPASKIPEPKILSHVNIFRWVLAFLEGKNAPAHEEENISIFNGKNVLARDGVPLERFEPLPNAAFADFQGEDDVNSALADAAMRLEMSLMKNDFSHLPDLVKDVIAKAALSPFDTGQYTEASKVLIQAGYVTEGVQLLDSRWQDYSEKFNYTAFFHLVKCHLALGNNATAESILYKGLSIGKYPRHGSIRYLMQTLARQEKYKEALPLIPKLFSAIQDLNYEPVIEFPLEIAASISILEHAKGHEAAQTWLDEQMEDNRENQVHANVLRINKIMLMLKHNRQEARAMLHEYFKNEKAMLPGLLLLSLRLAIETGDMGEAQLLYKAFDEIPDLNTNPYKFLFGEEIIKKGTADHLSLVNAKRILSKQILSSGYFDETWYEKTYKPALPPIFDYLKNSMILLRNPNPSFDTFFYLCSQPCAIFTGLDALFHYIAAGATASVSMYDEPFIRNSIHPALKDSLKETT